MIDWQLWPFLLGACVAAPLIALAAVRLGLTWRLRAPRNRLLRGAEIAGAALILVLGVYASLIEPSSLVVRRQTIESADWRQAPLRIVVIGDLHIGSPHVGLDKIAEVVARADALHADLIVLLGDYVGQGGPRDERSDRAQDEIANGIALLAALDARYGVVAVLGNHDAHYDSDFITSALQAAGIATLRNRNLVIRRGETAFTLVGLGDGIELQPDYEEALDGAPEGVDRIVLSHGPDPFAESPPHIALTLAAHTHCGQVWLPLLGRPITGSRYWQRYACHFYEERGMPLFVTGGVGTSNLPLRFLNPPEIDLITLRGRGMPDAPEEAPREQRENGGSLSG